MALLDEMKDILRISADITEYNGEIQSLIDEAKAELLEAGVLKISEEDPNIKKALRIYVKAFFGLDNPDREALKQCFDMKLLNLTGSLDYAYYEVLISIGHQTKVIFDYEEKETDQNGDVSFYVKPKNNVKYVVDGVEYYIDVDGDEVIVL